MVAANNTNLATLIMPYGIGGNKKISDSASSIHEYKGNLEGGKHPSAEEEPFIPDILMMVIESQSNSAKKAKLMTRAYDGFYVACHTFAVMSGKEKSYGEGWDKEHRLCSNMICQTMFGCSGIYKGKDIVNIIPDSSEYGIEGNKPIITPEILVEAFRRYPVKEILVGKMKLDNAASYVDVDEFLKNMAKNAGDSMKDIIDMLSQFMKEFMRKKAESEHPVDSDEDENIIEGAFRDVTNDNKDDKKEKKLDNKEKSKEQHKKEESPKIEKDKTSTEDSRSDTKGEENSEQPKEEPKAEQPIIHFDNDKLNLNMENGANKVPTKQAEKFDRIFGEYLKGKSYELFKLEGGPLNCVIKLDNGGHVSHIIDPSLCIGDDWYVVAPILTNNPLYPVDTIMVHPSEKEILTKIFAATTQKYILTPDEHQKVLTHMFKNQRIYSVFDMSNMSDRLLKLKKNPEEFRKLGQKLTYIINCIDGTAMLGRMRFSKWSGIDNFELRSDDDKKMRCPFPPYTLMNFTGVVVQVTGDDVVINFNGNSQKYTITEYGVL